jgi:hypothetical protein
MNSRRLMCCPQSEDRTQPHRDKEIPRCASQQIWRPMSQLGQKRRFRDVRIASALPLKADIHRKVRHVSKVPHPDSCAAAVCSLFDQLVGAGEKE